MLVQPMALDVSGIIEKFNVCYFDHYTKDDIHQQSFLIGSYIHQNTTFRIIREKNFTLITCLLEEFGSSTISHLFRKRLLGTVNKVHCH